jgi:hypothetical protein
VEYFNKRGDGARPINTDLLDGDREFIEGVREPLNPLAVAPIPKFPDCFFFGSSFSLGGILNELNLLQSWIRRLKIYFEEKKKKIIFNKR